MNDESSYAQKPAPRGEGQLGDGRTDIIEVQSLFRGGDQVELLHNGEIYRLRITSKGRLILTK